MAIISSLNAYSLKTGGNLWPNKHSTNNTYYSKGSVFMDSVAIISSNVYSLKTGGNPWPNKHSTNNITYYSTFASKSSQHKTKTQIEYNPLRFQKSSLNHHYKCVEGGTTYQECNKKYVVKAVPRPSFDSEPHASDPQNTLNSIKSFLITLSRFFYVHVMMNQILGAISVSLLAVEKLSDISPLFFTSILQAEVPYLLMLIYSNGLNQLADIEIDKINKPHLPLASKQFSYTTGVIVTASSLILSIWFSWIIGSWPLIWGLVINFLTWTAYSVNVPFLRWKRSALLTTICIFHPMTLTCPISFFLHMQTFVLKRPIMLPRSLISYIVFLTFYSIGISLFKDIPDVEGDKNFGINSLAIRLGQKKVFWICIFMFEMAFGVGLLAGALSSYLWIKIVTGLGHTILASVLWYHAKSVDLKNNASITSFYMLIWKLLHVAYFLLSLIR